MARQIVKLPNGSYGSWSTIIDNFVSLNMTREEYIEERAIDAYNDKREELTSMFESIEKGKCIGIKDYDECLEIIEEIHGIGVVKEIETCIKQGEK